MQPSQSKTTKDCSSLHETLCKSQTKKDLCELKCMYTYLFFSFFLFFITHMSVFSGNTDLIVFIMNLVVQSLVTMEIFIHLEGCNSTRNQYLNITMGNLTNYIFPQWTIKVKNCKI